ncbi:multiple inositol polyphosphate phosphatase 1-like [Cucumis melo var. makuwa]|uniref:Multiple inositol polyphosphate phosphatase 1 n=1 Tax=Cucumis melo var. makuwa TaxID=1194695 RepID=A0A5D3BHR1_CUCMM|nr:multiple inositol polyphosphate phosphatase 1-like [Cucumis melo var. makuwa]TYJ98813.1 multiple inositol polyphosphate phosphatase 1-like [Cucumis melo var. makuwa]
MNGGELIPQGEKELYDLGIRTRKLFPDLFIHPYHSDIYTINATRVARASASAVAFGMGLFNGSGSLGSDRHQAFSVVTESSAIDTMLRFFDCCHEYKEASLFDITDQACGLFTPSEHFLILSFAMVGCFNLLEWTDDVEVFKLKGYGNSLNYRMGVHLLKDVVNSMDKAIDAKKENQVPGTYEKARLRFSHAETLIPFTCLLGLFLEDEEGTVFRASPRPPATRNWKVSDVAPFAGNNMLVLYSCPLANSSDEYFVRVLPNEKPIAMPGCDGSDFCSFQKFKDKIVAPHLKHDFHKLCTVNKEESEVTLESNRQQEHTSNNPGFTCSQEFTHGKENQFS